MAAQLMTAGQVASSRTQLGARPRGAAATVHQQQRQQRRQPSRRRGAGSSTCCGPAAVTQEPSCSGVQQEQDAAQPPRLLQQLGRAAAGVAAAAVLALGSAAPAGAVLANPRAPVPRSADVALRRSIPAFNADVAEVQSRLEDIQFKLRIPQRKPWGAMAEDAEAAAVITADRERMMAGVLPGDEGEAAEIVRDLSVTLERLSRAIEVKDPDRTSIRAFNALEQVASLELLQAPGLPYQLPRQVAGYPVLTGRAVVELTVEKADGERVFIDPNSDKGPQKRATLRLVLDGYSAPITAANLLLNAQQGLYNGATLSVSGNAVLAGGQASGGGAAEAATLDAPPPTSGRRTAPADLPLEILAAGDFEPVYRSPLDVRNGELPVLPLSIYGAVAMSNLPDNAGSGYVSGTSFFIYKFDRQQAGLAGLSFDEGQFGVVGYITKGLDSVGRLESGDRIVKVEVVSGLDKLVRPQQQSS